MGKQFTGIDRSTTFFNLFLFAVASQSATQNYCIPADMAAGIDHDITTVKTVEACININNSNTGFSSGGKKFGSYFSY